MIQKISEFIGTLLLVMVIILWTTGIYPSNAEAQQSGSYLTTNWQLSKVAEFTMSWTGTSTGVKTYSIDYLNVAADSVIFVVEGADSCEIHWAAIKVGYSLRSPVKPFATDTIAGALGKCAGCTTAVGGLAKAENTANQGVFSYGSYTTSNSIILREAAYQKIILQFYVPYTITQPYSPRVYLWMWRKGF